MTQSTQRAPPPWRWSIVLTVVGLIIWGAAEYRSGLYALRTGGGDWLDTLGRVAFSCGAGLGVFVGSIITVWLFTGGVRQRRQAWIGAVITAASLFVACWNLSRADALPRQRAEAAAFRAGVVYQDDLAKRRKWQGVLAQPYIAPQDRRAAEEAIAETDASMMRGQDPVEGHATWLEWLLACGQHLLAAGFGSAFRIPMPERPAKRPPKAQEKPVRGKKLGLVGAG